MIDPSGQLPHTLSTSSVVGTVQRETMLAIWARAAQVRENVRQAKALRTQDQSRRARAAQERVLARLGIGISVPVVGFIHPPKTLPDDPVGRDVDGNPRGDEVGSERGRLLRGPICTLYVWGYGPFRSDFLHQYSRPSEAARRFAAQQRWNARRSDTWARELSGSGSLFHALAILEPEIREEPAVIGWGGQSATYAKPPGAADSPSFRPPAPQTSLAELRFGPYETSDDMRPTRHNTAGTGIETTTLWNHERALFRCDELTRRLQAIYGRSKDLGDILAARRKRSRELSRLLAATLRTVEALWSTEVVGSRLSSQRSGPVEERSVPERGALADQESRLPDSEFQALNQVVSQAHDLAGAGCLAAGYSVLLCGLHRAEESAASGQDWGHFLIRVYNLALDNYASRYGLMT